MPKPLSRVECEDVLTLTEELHHLVGTLGGGDAYGLSRWDWPRLQNADNFDEALWLKCVGYATAKPDNGEDGDDGGEFDLEFDPNDSTRLRYHARLRTDWVSIPMDEAALFAANMPVVLAALGDLLGIPGALRKADALLADVLWLLGTVRVGNKSIPVYLARKYSQHQRAILTHLLHPELSDFGLVLTMCRQPVNLEFPLPRQLKVFRLVDLLTQDAIASVDREKLARVVGSQGQSLVAQAPLIQFDSVANTLTLGGVDKPWVLHGDKQAKAIAYLVSELKKGREAVSSSELLRASGGRSPSVLQLFDGGPWREYLSSPVRGQWRFY